MYTNEVEKKKKKKEEERYILNTISITINLYIAVPQGRLEKYNS